MVTLGVIGLDKYFVTRGSVGIYRCRPLKDSEECVILMLNDRDGGYVDYIADIFWAIDNIDIGVEIKSLICFVIVLLFNVSEEPLFKSGIGDLYNFLYKAMEAV